MFFLEKKQYFENFEKKTYFYDVIKQFKKNYSQVEIISEVSLILHCQNRIRNGKMVGEKLQKTRKSKVACPINVNVLLIYNQCRGYSEVRKYQDNFESVNIYISDEEEIVATCWQLFEPSRIGSAQDTRTFRSSEFILLHCYQTLYLLRSCLCSQRDPFLRGSSLCLGEYTYQNW